MFQYNGTQYTLQDVIGVANDLGLTLSEYLEKNPDVKEIEDQQQNFQEPAVSKNEFDAGAELKTADDKFLISAKFAGAALADVPAYFNRFKMSVARQFITDEQKEKFDSLSAIDQDKLTQSIGSVGAPGAINFGGGAMQGQELSKTLRSEAEKMQKNLIKYDNDITDTFLEGNITEGTTRLLTEVAGAIPSVMQAMIPIFGIPSIVVGSAAEASREAVYDEGRKIDLKQQLYSLGVGFSEGLLELTTKKIGTAAFKNILGKSKDVVRKTLLQTATGIVKAGGKEGLSETGTLALNKFLESQYYDDAGKFIMSEKRYNEFWDEAGDTFLIGFATGKSIAGSGATGKIINDAIGDRSVRKTLEKSNVNEISEAFIDDNVSDDVINLTRNSFSKLRLDKELKTKVDSGELSLNESNEIKINFTNAQAAIKIADEANISPKLINETVSLLQERNQLSTKIEKVGNNKALVVQEIERLAEIDARIAEISKENISIRIDEKIEELEKPIKPPGSLLTDPLGIITISDKVRQAKLKKAKSQKANLISNQINNTYTEETTNNEWFDKKTKKGIADNAIADLAGDYENGPLARIIKNKITGEISRLPGFSQQDFVGETVLALIPHIRNYKPESIKNNPNNTLSGWINGFIDKKISGVLGTKKATKEQFEADVTDQVNVIDESDLNLESATPETSNAIFNKTGLNEEAADKGSKEILKGKLPGLNEKAVRDKNPFLTAIEKASEGKFFETIYQKLGGNLNKKNFESWQQTLEQDIDDFLKLVEESGNKDYNRIKNKYLKGIYKGKLIRRAKAKEGGTAAGEGRYEYKTPTRQEAIDYFTKGGMTTLIERKKTYTKILAHAVGKKGISKVIKDPQVQKEFQDIQQILGKEVPKNIEARIIASLDRVIKVLETPIRPEGTLTADFGLFVAEAAREIALAIAKGIRAALKKGISFAKAKKQVIKEVASELNLNKKLENQFVKEASAAVTLEDILTNNLPKRIEKVYTKITIEKFKGSLGVQLKNLKEKLNSLKTDKAKQNLLKKFFGTISQTFQKPAQNKIWKGSGARPAYNYYQKELGIKLKDLGFTLVKSGKGESIAFENKPIFAPAGRPSTHKGYRSKKSFYTYEFYEDIIDDMDSRSEYMKAYLLSEISSLLNTDGKQAVLDFISIQGYYSDSPLKLVGKLNVYEKGKGPLVYEHTPPIKSLQQDIYDILNSTDSKRQILNKVKKVLESSKVDLILKTSETKLNKLGRKTSGTSETRYEGAIKPENLIKFKRSKEKAAEIYAERNLNEDLNKIIEDKTGLPFQAKYSQAVAKRRGKRKGMMNFFIPHGAEDFQGLMYALLPKGEKGNAAMEWMKQNLFHPYAVAMENINRERMQMMNDFKALKRNLSNVPKKLKQTILKGDFTNEDAVRMWVWNSMGVTAKDLKISETVFNQLVNIVENNPDFLEFAEQLKIINKAEGYPKPDTYWNAGNITTDLLGNLNTTKRKKHLELWKNNVDAIFDEDMYSKLEGEFGKNYVVALKNILTRMESGRNRTGGGGDAETSAWLDWINNSVGTIMFLNVRSAVLQTISTINYMNWSDNNPLKAAKAFANSKQYWKDFKMIFNSDYIIERRGGLKINIAENEIADMASRGGVRGAISYLLNKGFVLTRMADSFAIANGGAAFYRNRVNTYLKQGLSKKEAEQKAFANFRELTEEAQQSSRPDRISKQQASDFGRIILAFGNTPMQYTRLMKRGAQDLINRRGDWKTNMSKILYYGIIQNFIFNAMHKALFALGFSEEEDEEEEEKKYISVAEGMADSVIRGTGIYGAAVMTAKNIAVDVARRAKRPRPQFEDAAWKILDISPPISSKISKVRRGLSTFDYQLDEIKEKGLSLENPAVMAGSQFISAGLNIPLDRVVRLMDNYRSAVAEDTETWQRVALLLGWNTWDVDVEKNDKQKKKESKSIEQQAKDRLKKHLEKFKKK